MSEWSTAEYFGMAVGFGLFIGVVWVGWERLKRELGKAKSTHEKYARVAVALLSNLGLMLMLTGGGLFVGSLASSNLEAGDVGKRVALWGLWLVVGAIAVALLWAFAKEGLVGGDKKRKPKKKTRRR